MAQTGYNTIQLYYSTTASAVPSASNLALGEIALNITDGKLFYKDNLGVVQSFSSGGSMVYPAAGIANSTGSAWGTSYSTTGSGTVVALATSPTLVTPALGTPTSGTLTNCTGLPLSTGVTGTLATSNGGTGLTTFTAANNAIYSTDASTLTAGTLPVLAGGTGTTTSTGTGDVVLSIAPTLTGAVTIGSTTGSDTITLGRSTGAQTVNVASGANSLSAKTVNIATGATNGSTTVTIGPTGAVNGTTTINIGTQARASNVTTVNIGTNGTGGNTNIVLGTQSGGSTSTTVYGASNFVLGSAQLTLGSSGDTGTISLGSSTVTQVVNVGAGATSSGNTKTLNIGILGQAGSTTNITIGTSSGGTSNTTLNGTVTLQNALAVTSGGTGQTSYTDGQLLIGNSTGNTLTKATLTAGSGISITNGSGSITIASTGGSGTVTSITAGTGLTGGTITTSGTIAIDTGVVATLSDTQTLTNKTLTSPTITGATLNDGYTEEVYAVVDAAGVALSPTNGSIQTWTLGASRTPTAGTWAAGQSITLMINDSGSSFTVTWTSLPVTWVGGTAPSLAPASGFTIITLWKVGTTIYGALVGQVT